MEEILKTAQDISADLIVMGSHGHGPVYNLLVGSVTEGVLKAGQRPVLLVPAPATGKWRLRLARRRLCRETFSSTRTLKFHLAFLFFFGVAVG